VRESPFLATALAESNWSSQGPLTDAINRFMATTANAYDCFAPGNLGMRMPGMGGRVL